MKFSLKSFVVGAAVLSLAACGGAAAGDESTADTSSTLTVVTHESFSLPDELREKFAAESGLEVTYIQPGDSGSLVNQLILTKDSPLGDVVYGIDNTYASRTIKEGVLTDYQSMELVEADASSALPGLTPIDFGDVCINADKRWFADKGLELPVTLDDLLLPQYRDLLVVSHPASSSPGLAFLFATVSENGEEWLDYWAALKDNGLKVTSGWTEAYYTDFSGADGAGPRPLVLSYATSPAYTVDGDESTTVSLQQTCFRQIEYAGVIKGAQNEAGAEAFIDFLLSTEVQEIIPTEMYMYPAVTSTTLPEEWARFAPLSDEPFELSADEIDANRDEWIRSWTEAMG